MDRRTRLLPRARLRLTCDQPGASSLTGKDDVLRWLNYHHLLYFWTVARTGSIARASRDLFVSQPAISTQIRQLEAVVGEPLFVRASNRLELTEAGRLVLSYADEIFRIGGELRRALAERNGRPTGSG